MTRTPVISEVSGTVWELLAAPGDVVEEGQELMLIESMKMELGVMSPASGTLVEILVAKDDPVAADQTVMVIAS
ncbi:Biotin-requiring enzyme [Albimonas donghaensis]|uniref:Biotin-requiring enzyme n=1 Tax=Albimonas donghaensis TaxID=356660 RepID=A0A1H3DWA2_9RHOB|nr:acetyl-CoA carboxylase biotin carboxyl carrier protein subunit [Albimonas donghaensis]SDX69869.1 Biotin-requiring enzyme [Albimonas donghaensis]